MIVISVCVRSAVRTCRRVCGKNALPRAAEHSLACIYKIDRVQQILKHLDNVQHSLYLLTPLMGAHSSKWDSARGFVPDQVESISRCEHGSASHRTPARADHARKAPRGRCRKSKSEPAQAASPDPGKYRGHVFPVLARIGQTL